MGWTWLPLVLCLSLAAEDAVPPEVLEKVNAVLAAKDASQAKKLEADLAAVPFDVLARAVREAPRGEAHDAGPAEFEIAVPGGDAKTKVCCFLPIDYSPEKSWPMVVSMHGTNGHAEEERARWAMHESRGEGHAVVVCPEEQAKLWGTGWGSTEPERALTLAAIGEAARRFRIDPDRVFLTGVSRGGHATWEMGLLYGDRLAGLYANAGGPRLINFGYLHNLGGLPLLESLGAKDQPMLVGNVRAAVEQMKGEGCEVVFHEHADKDHAVGYGDDPEFIAWFDSKRRDLWPKRIVHAFSRVNQGRAYWVQATKVANGVLDPTKERPSVSLPGGRQPSEEEARKLYLEQLEAGVARLDAKVEGNRIDVTTRKVTEVVVYLSDKLVDLSQPVEVWVNGKRKHEGKVERDAARMLEHVRETGDRGRIIANWIRIAVN